MRKRKTYSSFEKIRAKNLASQIGVAAAARQRGIPESTLRSWGAKGPNRRQPSNISTSSSGKSGIQNPSKQDYSPRTRRICGTFALVVGVLAALVGVLIPGGIVLSLLGCFLVWAGLLNRKKASDGMPTPPSPDEKNMGM